MSPNHTHFCDKQPIFLTTSDFVSRNLEMWFYNSWGHTVQSLLYIIYLFNSLYSCLVFMMCFNYILLTVKLQLGTSTLLTSLISYPLTTLDCQSLMLLKIILKDNVLRDEKLIDFISYYISVLMPFYLLMKELQLCSLLWFITNLLITSIANQPTTLLNTSNCAVLHDEQSIVLTSN